MDSKSITSFLSVKIMEKHFFLKNSIGKDLRCVHYNPGVDNNGIGIVICQPIAEERSRSKRLLVNLSRYLCSKGYHTILFDYFGEGDSEGEFKDATIKSRVSDVRVVIDFLKKEKNLSDFGLIGLRLGASLACIAVENFITPKFLLMIQPIIIGEEYIQDWLKINLSSQLVRYGSVKFNRHQLVEKIRNGEIVENEGYIVSNFFYNEVAELNLITSDKKKYDQAYVVEVKALSNSGDKRIKEFISSCTNNIDRIHYHHIRGTNFWSSLRVYNPNWEELFIDISNLLTRNTHYV